MQLFDLFATISLDSSSFDRGIDRAMERANQLGDGISSVLDGISGEFNLKMPIIEQSGADLIRQSVKGVLSVLPEMAEAAESTMEIFAGTLDVGANRLYQTATGFITKLADGTVSSIPVLTDKMPLVISAAISALVAKFPDVATTGIRFVVELGRGIVSGAELLPARIAEVVGIIKSAFQSRFGEITDVGNQMVKGLWDGISSAGTWLKERVDGFFGNLVGGVKNFLGIHSPSRVFAEIGGFMGLGLAQGLEDSAGDVDNRLIRAFGGLGEDLPDGLGFDFSLLPEAFGFMWREVEDTTTNSLDFQNRVLDSGLKSGLGVTLSYKTRYQDAGTELFAAMLDGMKQKFDDIQAFIDSASVRMSAALSDWSAHASSADMSYQVQSASLLSADYSSQATYNTNVYMTAAGSNGLDEYNVSRAVRRGILQSQTV